jgi:hypothetical protein
MGRGVAVIAWGYLNDLRLKTPQSVIVNTVRQKISTALATYHLVLLVSPPAAEPACTFDKQGEAQIWDKAVRAARTFHDPRVHVLSVMDPMMHYIRAHHQTCAPVHGWIVGSEHGGPHISRTHFSKGAQPSRITAI